MSARTQKASVLIIVLVTIVFVSAALVAFVQRATDDLLVPTRQSDASRLRAEAYSALETTLAVLVDFRLYNNPTGLHSPNEGWGDPLGWVNYTPLVEGRTVTVSFEDESGKMSLPVISSTINTNNLTTNSLYYYLTTVANVSSDDAGLIQDSLLTWMKKNYSPTSSGATTAAQYEQDTIPFAPPSRSLRSWYELQAIDGVSGLFFDSGGRLTDIGHRFIADFSLYNFASSNVNAGNIDTIETLAQVADSAAQSVLNVVTATESGAASTNQTSSYFSTTTSAAEALGVASLNPRPAGGRVGGGGGATLGVTISALRVNVVVKEGQSRYTLSALVSWPAGTTTTGTALATPVAAPTVTASAANAGITPTTANAAMTTTVTTSTLGATVALNYPYTILEFSESDLDPAVQNAQNSTATTTPASGATNASAAGTTSYSNVNLPPPTT